MTKSIRNILIIVVITIVLFALICIIYQHFSQKPLEKADIGEGEILPDANDGLDDMINEILDENIAETEEKQDKEEKSTVSASSNPIENEEQMTAKETKAINLVKEKCIERFGSINGKAFNISIQSNGKYLVTVYDTKTTKTIIGYIVDVTTEIVNEK